MRRTILISMIVFSGLLLTLALPARPASAWAGDVTITPSSAVAHSTKVFSITVYNEGDTTLVVNWIQARFCWQTSNQWTHFKDEDFEVPIAVGSSGTFSATTKVGAYIFGSCSVDVSVNGAAYGDSYSTQHFTLNIEITRSATPSSLTDAIILLLVVVFAVIFAVVLFVILKGRMPRYPGPPQYPQPFQRLSQQPSRRPYKQPPRQQQPGDYQRPRQPP